MNRSLLLHVALVVVFSLSTAAFSLDFETYKTIGVNNVKDVESFAESCFRERQKNENISETFRRVHESSEADLESSPVVEPESKLDILRPSLDFIACYIGIQYAEGRGNIDYWLRTYGILRQQGLIAAGEIDRVLAECGDAIDPVLKMSISMIARDIRRAANRHVDSSGKEKFWKEASFSLQEAFLSADENLKSISSRIGTGPYKSNALSAKVTLTILARIFKQQSAIGKGEWTYWKRTYELLNRQLELGILAINDILTIASKDYPFALYEMLYRVWKQMLGIKYCYEDTQGIVDHWFNATNDVCGCMHNAAEDIEELLKAL